MATLKYKPKKLQKNSDFVLFADVKSLESDFRKNVIYIIKNYAFDFDLILFLASFKIKINSTPLSKMMLFYMLINCKSISPKY